MSNTARWSDLGPRVISAVVMLAIGAVALWLGGYVFAVGVWVIGALMIWELVRMLAPDARGAPVRLALVSGGALVLAWLLPGMLVLPLLIGAAIVGAGQLPRDWVRYACFAAAILLACHAMVMLREVAGLAWILWVICVVIASDVAGYFVGKTLGGRKFWPRISPKKTWSGTIGGWVAAALVGFIFGAVTGAGVLLAPISVLIAFAGQMGDIWESAIKRHAGVKDSSNLIPGHGGVLDRFDAMLGAALAASLLWGLSLMPGLA
ncbi:phosphatidate cytidylyltransferase [Pseudohalocynthiibacter aestuariivivens]|uniref:Phosphatidate cytidylyltransferase n=1 Tax=Roseovarius pelagicus TaxID=2980108 RepID=A0ABY6DC66_9RHOB|nr:MULTISPECIES: phosphatidate cytidylyltransferase [Rhodobacterales]QIE44364.1 phosphatidate cytidylyltransferase [Pseudohalocynthiibacter aestuariivivens]UXX83722.1 phosphatidate cytidylyltransferase [Roseovarius pelagicus]